MKNLPLLAPKKFTDFTQSEFVDYVRGLKIRRSTESKSVSDVGISFAGKRVTVRVKREPKYITRDEVALLAQEHDKNEMEVLELFLDRKMEIRYADTDERTYTDRAWAETKREAKRNAKPRKTGKRKASRKNKLLEPGHDSHLHAQSRIQPSTQSESEQRIGCTPIWESDSQSSGELVHIEPRETNSDKEPV